MPTADRDKIASKSENSNQKMSRLQVRVEHLISSWNRLQFFIQEKLYCTEKEARVMVSLMALIILGNAIQMVRAEQPLFDDAYYAGTDSLFRMLAAQADSMEAVDTVRIGFQSEPIQFRELGKELEMWVIVDTLEKPTTTFPVNINTADAKTLQALPRIGPRMAERILAYRAKSGPFVQIEDLKRVKGIGDKTLERLLPLVTLEDAQPDSSVVAVDSLENASEWPDSSG
jgi:competence ComEA-like helix-hairpin-helix protein